MQNGQKNAVSHLIQAVGLETTQRWLTVAGEKRQLELAVLMPGKIYVTTHSGPEPLKCGAVLVRNLELSRLKYGWPRGRLPPGEEVFLVYPDLYSAIRGIHQIPGGYRVETGKVDDWQKTVHWLMQIAWAMRAGDESERAQYEATALEKSGQFLLRNVHKQLARDKMLKGSRVEDSRGRRNPGRLPPILWSTDEVLQLRQNQIPLISGRMDERVVVLAGYLDKVFRFIRVLDGMLANFSTSQVVNKGGTDQMREEAGKRLTNWATALRRLDVRPFGPKSFWYLAKDLGDARLLIVDKKRGVDLPLLRARESIKLLEVQRQIEEILFVLAGIKPEPASVLGPDKDTLQTRLHQIIKQLADVDENGFQKPIKLQVRQHLSQAVEYLERGEKPQLRFVYEVLKRATVLF